MQGRAGRSTVMGAALRAGWAEQIAPSWYASVPQTRRRYFLRLPVLNGGRLAPAAMVGASEAQGVVFMGGLHFNYLAERLNGGWVWVCKRVGRVRFLSLPTLACM